MIRGARGAAHLGRGTGDKAAAANRFVPLAKFEPALTGKDICPYPS
jgi:hypothetical protein